MVMSFLEILNYHSPWSRKSYFQMKKQSDFTTKTADFNSDLTDIMKVYIATSGFLYTISNSHYVI